MTMTTHRLAAATVKMVEAMADPGSPDPADADLRYWPGWGPVASLLAPVAADSLTPLRTRLGEALTDAEWDTATRVVDTSYFTPDHVVTAVFEILEATGHRGGNILEPGCGTGAFMGSEPAGWGTRWVGVEQDVFSARVARKLHPAADIRTATLQDTTFRDGEFTAVVGNVPFSASNVWDPAPGMGSMRLHHYFLARALQAVQPGGFVLCVTSRWVMDAAAPGPWAQYGRVVGAIRFPAGTFTGTDTVADLMVLQRGPGDSAGMVGTRDALGCNTYWADHPHHVIGTHRAVDGPHRVTVDPPDNVADGLAVAVASIRDAAAAAAAEHPPLAVVLSPTVGAGGMVDGVDGEHRLNDDGTVSRFTTCDGWAPVKAAPELVALLRLRAAAMAMIHADSDPAVPDETADVTRAAARDLWSAYVSTYGPLNRGVLQHGPVDPETGEPRMRWRRPRMGGFRDDPFYHSVAAVECYDQETGEYTPAPILLRRIRNTVTAPTTADSPAEALAISLGETGGVDLDRIGVLLGCVDHDATLTTLGDLVVVDPATRDLVPTVRYTCGNIREKYEQASAAAETDHAFTQNLRLLGALVPPDLPRHQIQIRLGSPVVEPADVAAFVWDLAGIRVAVDCCNVTGTWTVSEPKLLSPKATVTWGIPAMPLHTLVNHLLNGKTPVVYEESPDGRRQKSHPLTVAAQAKAKGIDTQFERWVWQDAARAARLARAYNDSLNCWVPPIRDGSWLQIPGLSPHLTPHPWQTGMAAMALTTPGVFCGHTMGAGKTLTAAITAVTLRRYGLATKPLIVVPPAVLDQFARELQQAFPLGKFLIASKHDLSAARRRAFVARVATGEWDAVVMAHTTFSLMPVHPATESAVLAEQEAALIEASRHHQDQGSGRFVAKELARRLRSVQGRMRRLRAQPVDVSTGCFEQLGVDYLIVDEAHLFKNLDTGSAAEGFTMTASKRATDMLVKSRWVKERQNGRPFAMFMSGTPFTNTLLESYVWYQYLAPEVLHSSGIWSVDAYAAVFARRAGVTEIDPSGTGVRTVTRVTSNTNRFTEARLRAQYMDLKTAEDIGLPTPPVKIEVVACPPNPLQHGAITELAQRIRTTTNVLQLITYARQLTLDPPLVGIDEPSAKLCHAADRVAQTYHQYKDETFGTATPGALQMVFSDLGTPHPGDNRTYGRFKALLVDRGVPARVIRMVHDASNDAEKSILYAQARAGTVQVLMGSTATLGTGVNAQTRCVATHHLDTLWRPSDMEQRDGRAVRVGNLAAHVTSYRYVLQGSFDGFGWQTLQRKFELFRELSQPPQAVETDDIGEITPYMLAKALGVDSPLLLRQAELAQTLRDLRTVDAVTRAAHNHLSDELTVISQGMSRARSHMQTLQGTPVTAGHPWQLADWVTLLRDGRGKPCHWGSVVLRAVDRDGRRALTVEDAAWVSLTVRNATVGRIPVIHRSRNRLRVGTVDAAAEWLDHELREWVVAVPARVRELDTSLRQLKARFDATRDVMSRPVTTSPELVAAEREWAELADRIGSTETDIIGPVSESEELVPDVA